MTSQRLWIGLACFALAIASGVRASANDAELLAGIAEIKAGDYAGGILTLDRVVQRLSAQKASPEDLGPAYLYLGVAHVALGREGVGRAKFQQAFVHAGTMGVAPEEVSLDGALFPPRVSEVFEEVRKAALGPTSVPRTAGGPPVAAPSAPVDKKGRSKTPFILGGVALAGGAAAVAAAGGGGGDAAAAPASVSVPAAAPPGITLLGPASGSTVRAVGCPSGGACVQDLTLRYQVVTATALPRGFILSELYWGDRRCLYGVTDLMDMIAGQPQTVLTTFFVVDCPVPFTVNSVQARVFDPPLNLQMEQSFSLTISVVQ